MLAEGGVIKWRFRRRDDRGARQRVGEVPQLVRSESEIGDLSVSRSRRESWRRAPFPARVRGAADRPPRQASFDSAPNF